MKIAILGTRGIPNFHGGFEQFAEFFSTFLAENNHEVYVYCSSLHPYQKKMFGKVNLIHCKDPEDKIGTAGQFIYDLNCILDSRKRKFDLILQLGYTSSSIWHFLLPKSSTIITNMDGLEWKRSKYSSKVKFFLKYAEKLAAINSDFLVADSIGIQEYIQKKYNKKSKYIAYGAEVFNAPNENILTEFQLKAYNYDLIIARMEPENNIEVIIKGYIKSNTHRRLFIIGNHKGTKFGNYLYKNYSSYDNVIFHGGIYDLNKLNNLRFFSNIYFHGHSVGGTNPSLLEAMASNCLIIANRNIFNQSILGQDALYFDNDSDIINLSNSSKKEHKSFILNNIQKIHDLYSWKKINQNYLDFIIECQQKAKY
ncbi:DUF1972 domain-containing protein [Empedobacter brevis]|uniref:Rhamnosyltransferase n=1 Tax=Empedobacter brevis NBRC 14943 = ATCC 43319 TaxID=1218108 RepID=A0A511NKW5_9FLAO|nr:DUF1972 domain-containing protein [Empedobacter brevis]GEM53440.1 rhamnosyltransferase [Empedobacter brevis NBRC 14943 = ATCC 43319]